MKKDWTMSYCSGRPTEDWIFSQYYSSDASWNDSFWKHPRFNMLLKEARYELNEVKRREMYAEMQRIVSDEGGNVIPLFADFVDAGAKKLKFGELHGSHSIDGLRCAERWWFDS
jgi:peptide/nickel transport system substrate-binding protein